MPRCQRNIYRHFLRQRFALGDERSRKTIDLPGQALPQGRRRPRRSLVVLFDGCLEPVHHKLALCAAILVDSALDFADKWRRLRCRVTKMNLVLGPSEADVK